MLEYKHWPPHFKPTEFSQSGGNKQEVPNEKYWTRLRHLSWQMEIVRAVFNDSVIKILSGYRTPEYNKKIHGAKASQHMQARACDFTVYDDDFMDDFSTELIGKRLIELMKHEVIAKGGVGIYPTFVHYDIRGNIATWKGSRTGT